MKKNFNRQGIVLLEILVASALFLVLAGSISGLLIAGLNGLQTAKLRQRAQIYAQQAVEAVISIQDRAWNELRFNQSGLQEVGGQWQLRGEGTQDQKGDLMRTLYFFPLYRDANLNLVSSSSPLSQIDLHSLKLTVYVRQATSSKLLAQYSRLLSDWRSQSWQQSDWSGGGGQVVWQEENRYYQDGGNLEVQADGSLVLKEVATSTFATSSWIISSAYHLNASNGLGVIEWQEDLPPDCPSCHIKLFIKTAPDDNGLPGSWSNTWCGPEGEDGDETDYFLEANGSLVHTDHNGDSWIKYKAVLEGDGSHSPILRQIKIYYQ
ncbi:type II secretion system protein [Candidatus Parcubacteria bacterium]|nr:MAG: type II secretion system protein [Candidatus Parcubacteria bacterium]